MTQKKWDNMSVTEKYDYSQNETDEEKAQRMGEGIGTISLLKLDGTKVEGAESRMEFVRDRHPDAQIGSFKNAEGQTIYYPIYDTGPSDSYQKGGYLRRRGVVKRKRR